MPTMKNNLHPLQQQFQKYGKEQGFFSPGIHYLLAVSGGIDSMTMVHLFQQAGLPFSLVHCNFQLRGEESERDAAFVASEAHRLNVPLYSRNFETERHAALTRRGIQEAARELRYLFFRELLQHLGAGKNNHFVATAHHQDDNAETILFNIFRGTGLQGLTGIPPKRDEIIRPLLFASKQEILNYARDFNIEFVEDSSNDTTKYTRNFIRHNIMPSAEVAFGSPVSALNNLGARMREAGSIVQDYLDKRVKKLLRQEGNEFFLAIEGLRKSRAPQLILLDIARKFGFKESQIPELEKLMDAHNGAQIYAEEFRAIKQRNHLLFAPQDEELRSALVIETPGTYETVDGIFSIKAGSLHSADFTQLPPGKAIVDARQVLFPLVLRPWKAGDYFYPLGMRKKKKISRFLIDNKVSATSKEKAWVLASNHRIAWLCGYRPDDRFKITSSTKACFFLEWVGR